ncbi:lipopolysaccharide biosynthesis protein [Candidatus Marithrix sp. Canyon 246]|uniref:lipopolysaccharide biosynthesis protein n=1 Tax=Candidatus Marithrix sp. Canyon 246 TaxID=1827136 RepID=UPI00084A1F82|nr:oligosaccharide flippase family protein [Candidatus Marithrix sp. Canyon 246]
MKPIGHIATGSIIQQILSIIIFIILTRHLGAEGYGMVAAALALATSIYNFSNVWMAPYMIRAGAKQVFHYNKLGDVYVTTGVISFILMVLGLIIVILLESFKIINLNIYADLPLLMMLLSGLFFLNLFRIGLQSTQSFRGYGYSLWMDKIFYLAAIIILFFYWQLESKSALYGNAVAMLLIGILGLLYFAKTHISLKIKSFCWREFFKTTSPVLLATIALYFSSPPFVILLAGNLSGLEQAGFVSVAFVLFGFFLQPIQWITPTLLPKFTIAIESGNEEILQEKIDKVVFPFIIFYSIAVVAFIMITLSTPLIPYMIGEDFRQGIPVIVVIIGTVVAEVFHLLVISMLYARHQETLILIATVARSLSFLLIAIFSADSQLLIIGFLVSSWIFVAVEIWALRDLVSWKIRFTILILFGLFITLSFLIFMTANQTVLSACAFILLILGIMAFEHRVLFWNYARKAVGQPAI